jgi:hypothetical protein
MVGWWRPPPSPEVVGQLGEGIKILHLIPATSCGGEAAGENRASTTVISCDGGVRAPFPC